MNIEDMETRHIVGLLNNPAFIGIEGDIVEAIDGARRAMDDEGSIDNIRKIQGRIYSYKELLSVRDGLQQEIELREENSNG